MRRASRRDKLSGLPVQPSRLRWGDLLDEATLSILHKRGRSVLTVLGTVLGVATLICTLGLTATASSQVSARFDALEATKVVVKDTDSQSRQLPFPESAVERLRQLPGVVSAGESWTLPREVPARTVDRVDPVRSPPTLSVVALGPATLDAVGVSIGAGRGFDPFEVRRSEPVVLLGSGAAARLGIRTLTADRTVQIGPMRLIIAGIVTAAPRRPELLSTAMVVPGVANQLSGRLGAASKPERELTIQVQPGAAQVIGAAAPLVLGSNAPQRYQVEVPPSADEFRSQVQGDLGSVFLLLGAVALCVGVLGIANSGLVAVMQRTREFGVRRALGARAVHIASQVLFEAGVLGLLGGLAGLAVGLLVVVAAAAHKGWTPALDPFVTGLAPLLGLSTGLLAGVYPAWRASRIEPVEALRA
jgi:putative ABC transport system permease protein